MKASMGASALRIRGEHGPIPNKLAEGHQHLQKSLQVNLEGKSRRMLLTQTRLELIERPPSCPRPSKKKNTK